VIAAEERRAGARSPLRRGGTAGRRVGEGRRVAESPHVGDGDARGGQTSARPSSPVSGDGAARMSGRSGASERSGTAWRGEEAVRTCSSRKKGAIWGEMVKCPEVYTERPPFVTVRISNRTKTKGDLFVTVGNTNRDKRGIRAGYPEGEFSPFCHGWSYNP
jgi:hypothetical protein